MSLITTQFYKIVDIYSKNSCESYLFVISFGKFSYNEIIDLVRLKKPQIMSWAEAVFNLDKKEITIKWIETPQKQYKNKGFAKQILRSIIALAKQKQYKRIILDDMSDNYQAEHNLYKSVGFYYLKSGQPEMELIL